MDSRKKAALIAELAENKKANNVDIIDVQKFSAVASYFVIASGESSPQLKAMVEEIRRTLKNKKIKGFTIEGEANSGWVIIDTGDVIAHIMHERERQYYKLEELWGKQGITYHL